MENRELIRLLESLEPKEIEEEDIREGEATDEEMNELLSHFQRIR